MKIYEVKSFAKINLALHITGKLTKLHKIESIVKFIHLYDLITIRRIDSNKHKIYFKGSFSRNIKKDNTIDKLFKILDEQKLLNNKKFQIKVQKNIPQEAGLGGGSMNAATILNFLIKKKFVKINQKKILQITNLIGSDVILGINPKSTILSSNGVVKNFLKSPNFYILLVRPNFGCSTKKIYLGVKKFSKPVLSNPKKNMLNLRFKINDPVLLGKDTMCEWKERYYDHYFHVSKNEIDEIWITFPDPQLKKGRSRKRLTHPYFLKMYNAILKPNSKIHLKTDG